MLALPTSLRFAARMDRVSFFGELLDSRAALNDAGSFINNTVVNSLEPLQAYVAWTSRQAAAKGRRGVAARGAHDARSRQALRNVAESLPQHGE